MSLKELSEEIEKIKQRNKKVETDKAWETSWSRKVIIGLLSYLVVGFTLGFFGFPYPWRSASVPVIAFILSTLSLTLIKNIWLKTFFKK